MSAGRKTGGGSRKGRPNKVTGDVKAMILGALSAVGGQQYLEIQAIEQPMAFLALVGRVMPTQVTGAEGEPLIPAETDPSRIALALLTVLRAGAKDPPAG